MKIGSVAWGWTPTPEDMPSGNSLEVIADNIKVLGFDFVDYLCTRESLDGFFVKDNCKKLRQKAEDLGMWINGLAFQSDEWNNPDEEATAVQFKYLEKILQVANWLGAGTVSAIIPRPFASNYSKLPSPSDKMASNLPSDFCWQKEWGLFSKNMKKAAKMAAGYDVKIALECFARSLCSTPDAMLTLLHDVAEPNFGIQLDTSHLMNQNIDIETAIFMLGADNIFHVHAKDSDGLTRTNLAPGCGLIDFVAVFRALSAVGYKGDISVEVEFSLDPAQYMELGLGHVRKCMDKTGS
jgi:sugar phosphate isomerase/epimerase